MEQATSGKSRIVNAGLWVLTVVIALGMGLAGVTKFLQAARWEALFVGWGYPVWFSAVTGVLEIAGAVLLLIPRFTLYGGLLLSAVMLGAAITLVTHPGGSLGGGGAPLVYLILLLILGFARWRERSERPAQS